MGTIIAFTGPKQAGKTTALEFIKEEIPEAEKLSIAGHLKTVCSEVFELDSDLFYNNTKKELDLDNPVILEQQNIEATIKAFNEAPNYELHVRPYIGKILYTPRQLLQFVGTELLQNVKKSIHLDYLAENLDTKKVYLVDDLRFDHELNFFKSLEKNNVKVLTYYVNNVKAEEIAKKDPHPSEQGFKVFKNKCIHIQNNDNLIKYRNSIKTLIKEIF